LHHYYYVLAMLLPYGILDVMIGVCIFYQH